MQALFCFIFSGIKKIDLRLTIGWDSLSYPSNGILNLDNHRSNYSKIILDTKQS
jgi:hypothetical protein